MNNLNVFEANYLNSLSFLLLVFFRFHFDPVDLIIYCVLHLDSESFIHVYLEFQQNMKITDLRVAF